MSAEILRDAAAQMLLDFPDADRVDGFGPAFRAVAKWLTACAADVDKRDNPTRVGGRYEALRIPDELAAINVARAYLGGDQ